MWFIPRAAEDETPAVLHLLVKPAGNYSQIPAKDKEMLKRWKMKASPKTQYLTGSRALGKRFGFVNGLLCDKEHMAFTLKKKFWKSISEKGTLNLKQLHLVKGKGRQKEYLIWQELRQHQKFLLDLETENYS